MEYMVSASLGELFLKGKNRSTFIKQVEDNIKENIKDTDFSDIYMESGKIYIKAPEKDLDRIIEEASKIFGIASLSKVLACEKNLDDIFKATCLLLERSGYLEDEDKKTFKVKTTRVDKSFPLTSPEASAELGGRVLEKYPNLIVDVHQPDFEIYVDIKKNTYVYLEKIPGLGGLPIGTNGKSLLLLSGGIDSPVAGFMMAKRGVELSCVHFHSYPFTSKRALQKAIDLADLMKKYTGPMTVYSVNLADIYTAIRDNCDIRQTTILSRRFMMRISEKIANDKGIDTLVTGESLGQVASQTMQSLKVIDGSVEIPILRPLIGMDKTEIVKISQFMDTYDKSIEPYMDCCSIFAPDKPVTKPRLSDIEFSESKLDIEKLEKDALDTMEIFKIS